MARIEHSGGFSGIGVSEKALHPNSGLRIKNVSGPLSQGTIPAGGGSISGTSRPLGVAGGGAVDEWTAVAKTAAWRGRVGPMPMTPAMFISSVLHGAGTYVRFRLRGLGQFGEFVEEITPQIDLNLPDDVGHLIIASKIFSYVDEVEFKSNGLDSALGVTVDIGYINGFDPTEAEQYEMSGTATHRMETYGTERNNGFGAGIRLSPYGPDNPGPGYSVLGLSYINYDDGNGHHLAEPYEDNTNGGFVIGRSLAGWEGDANKIGFWSDDWPSFTGPRLSGPPATTGDQSGDVFADTIQWCITSFSHVGTQRDSMTE